MNETCPDLDMAIVVPSRHRSHNMPTILSLLPTALICIDEREEWEYRLEVPEDRLLFHPPFDGFASVINWCNGAVTSDILVIIDDDFQFVQSMTGEHRAIRRPEEIY